MRELTEGTYNFGGFNIDYNTSGQFVFYDIKNNWLVTIQPLDEYEFDFHLQHFYADYLKGEKTSFQIYTKLLLWRNL